MNEPTEEQVIRSYNDVKCVFCGYQPEGLLARLKLLQIGEHACWACPTCEIHAEVLAA